jgi:Fe-S-cluster containining protein
MLNLNQIIPQEACLKCQGCCRFAAKDSVWNVRLLREENDDLCGKDLTIELLANIGQGNFICKFLNTVDNKCFVYAKRPFECRLYPFLINRRSDKIYLSLDLQCPYAKNNIKRQAFGSYCQYLAGLFCTPKYKSVLKNNLHIIQEYDGSENIIELQL